MNIEAMKAIYLFEMVRMRRTILQSVVSPVLTTALYFVVFGTAIGSRIEDVDGVSYGAFIIPGLMMLQMLTLCTGNGSFGIYFPKFTGTIYEILSSPISQFEILVGYVGAAATKGMIVGFIILATAACFVDLRIEHPFVMLLFMLLTTVSFSLLGFIIGIWAKNFEQLNLIPMLVLPPLTFLGGSFYSIHMLPEFWQVVSHFNPVFYLVSGFRWSFYGVSEVSPWVSIAMVSLFLMICYAIVTWMFKTGYKLRN